MTSKNSSYYSDSQDNSNGESSEFVSSDSEDINIGDLFKTVINNINSMHTNDTAFMNLIENWES
jgi:hypothetical protein